MKHVPEYRLVRTREFEASLRKLRKSQLPELDLALSVLERDPESIAYKIRPPRAGLHAVRPHASRSRLICSIKTDTRKIHLIRVLTRSMAYRR